MVQEKLAQELHKVDMQLEDFVYQEIGRFWFFIKLFSKEFRVDPVLVTAIIFVERIQYQLPSVRWWLHKASMSLSDVLDAVTGQASRNPLSAVSSLSDWLNSSRGFSHIKWRTAKRLIIRHRRRSSGLVDQNDLAKYAISPKHAIKLTCAILREHVDQWAPQVDVSGRPAVLATLYNISDFENRAPHPSPRPGGSRLGVIVDGKYREGICFGNRVKMVMRSSSMNFFLMTR